VTSAAGRSARDRNGADLPLDPDLDAVLDAVGSRLRALRHRRGVTLAELHEVTGISVSTLSRLESGSRRPTLELLLPLARVHGVPIDELVGGRMQRFTDRTCIDIAALHVELDQVRERGYAVAIDELEVGLTAVAAPVRRADGTVVASLSASGPTFRLPPERLPEIADHVTTAARAVSRRLGWHGLPAVAGA